MTHRNLRVCPSPRSLNPICRCASDHFSHAAWSCAVRATARPGCPICSHQSPLVAGPTVESSPDMGAARAAMPFLPRAFALNNSHGHPAPYRSRTLSSYCLAGPDRFMNVQAIKAAASSAQMCPVFRVVLLSSKPLSVCCCLCLGSLSPSPSQHLLISQDARHRLRPRPCGHLRRRSRACRAGLGPGCRGSAPEQQRRQHVHEVRLSKLLPSTTPRLTRPRLTQHQQLLRPALRPLLVRRIGR